MATKPDASTVTLLLNEARKEGSDALPDLFACAYDRLHRLAFGIRSRWASDATTDTTALIHEVYLKLARGTAVEWEGRSHFFAVAARAMRQILTDHARRRSTVKRGGGLVRESVHGIDGEIADQRDTGEMEPAVFIGIDEALDRLAEAEPRVAQVVECRFYAGYTLAETAEILGVSVATVKRDWSFAQAWLFRELHDHRP